MTGNLSVILSEWQVYLQRANAVSAALSEELNNLFEPWPVKELLPQQRPTLQNNQETALPVSAEEEIVLNQVNRGLKKASRAREKAVQNLLPEIGAVREDGVNVQVEEQKTSDFQCSIVQGGETTDEVAVVTESALRDLVQKHLNPPIREGVEKSNVQKKKAKMPSDNSDLIKGRASSSTKSVSNKKPVPKAALKIPKPMSQHRSNMYTTSSSVIGKGVSSSHKTKEHRIKVTSAPKHSHHKPGMAVYFEGSTRSLSAPKMAGKSDSSRMNVEAKIISEAGHNLKGSAILDPLEARTCDALKGVSQCETGHAGPGETSSADRNSVRPRSDKLRPDLVNDGPSSEICGDASPQAFNLLCDGKNINIPASLKKHLASNGKWRHKIAQHSKFKSSKATGFLENLASSSNKHQDLIYSKILKEYEHLLEVAACTYQELEEETMLTTEKYEKYCKLYQEVSKKWTDVGERRQCLESDDLTPPRQTPTDIINYESLKQLEKYTQLKLQIQYLEFQLDLQRALSDELIPYLKTLDPGDEQFSSIFRKVKGLLCFGGETFPSLVKYDDSDEEDNTDDENELDDDEDEQDGDFGDNYDDSGNDAFHIDTSSSAIT
ncbi:Tubulin epsilon and delta complex protein 2 [Holothuria leucospilota]|uniref:Tubulin epsilon and delta complex protein 2 n=1 Tax=Holothuria leucospilota TaxID=206669 RepID=A0A9Q1C1Z1_HOLLE|nr:Tubulin epsilon and delta complex protein 2 [Holothuria leucospilota]